MKKLLLLITGLTLASCSSINAEDYQSDIPERPPLEDRIIEPSPSNSEEKLIDSENPSPEEIPNTDEAITIPAQLNLAVPFYSQAPDGDWSQPWQDACEESSLILAHYGLSGEPLSKDLFRQTVLDMVTWQNNEFGYYESTTVDQVVQLYEGFFEDAFEISVIESPSVEDLKVELAQNHLIVAPFAGQQLGNPFYSGEGPYYHMLVIKGYDETHFITNDVGTRNGENFIFTHDVLMNALHDYDKSNITSEPPRVIILSQ